MLPLYWKVFDFRVLLDIYKPLTYNESCRFVRIKDIVVWQFKLLGTLLIQEDGRPSTVMKYSKGCALLAYLIATGQPQRRESIADLLWDAPSTANSLTNLRKLIYRIRPLIPQLEITRQQLSFQANPSDDIDYLTLVSALEGADISRLDKALSLYQGELLDGFYLDDNTHFYEWLLVERERLHVRVLAGHRRLADWHEEQENFQEGVMIARRWVELNDLDEEAHRYLMRFLNRSGQPLAAMAQYQTLSQLFEEELGVTPSAETKILHDQIAGMVQPSAAVETNSLEAVRPKRSRYDWGEAPGTSIFYGRDAELATLNEWMVANQANLVTILGIGGQGKTALAALAARSLANQFVGVYWRSLINGPPLKLLLSDYLSFISQDSSQLSEDVTEQLALIRHYLQNGRHLLVLDNMETILDSDRVGQFRAGYEDYEHLLHLFANGKHENCLLITSREAPAVLNPLALQSDKVQSLQLSGLTEQAGENIFEAVQIMGDKATTDALVRLYSGNPLALKLSAQTIQEFYFGDAAAFLAEEGFIFDDIRDVLDQQFRRLSALEQEIMLWLAITREETTPQQLQKLLLNPGRQIMLIEAMRRLQRRSLLEQGRQGFALQNVVTEYLTETLIQKICQEISASKPLLLNRFALMLAQSKEYIRQSQERILLQPIAKTVTSQIGSREAIEQRIKLLLENLRRNQAAERGYAAGNLLNLLLTLEIDLTGYDFSALQFRQAYLQGAALRNCDFSDSDLKNTVFTNIFGRILCLAVSPDGSLVAGGTAEGIIHFWQVEGGQFVKQILAHTEPVMELAYSPDGRFLASAGWDGLICLWETETGDLWQTYEGHTNIVWTVAFSPDGSLLASGGEGGDIRLWQLSTGDDHFLPSENSYTVRDLIFSPDGRTLASGGEDKVVRLWDMTTRKLRQTLSGHTSWIQCISFRGDGKLLASGGGQHDILLWDVQSGDLLYKIEGHSDQIRWLTFSPDDQTLASASEDGTVRIWGMGERDKTAENSLPLHTYRGHRDWAIAVEYSRDGRTVISSGNDWSLHFWNTRTSRLLRSLEGYKNDVIFLEFNPHNSTLISGSYDHAVRVWDVDSGQILHTFGGHRGYIAVAVSSDGSTIATCSEQPIIQLWDIHRGQLSQQFSTHVQGQRMLALLAFSPDGQTLAGSGADSVIYLWERETGRLRQTLDGHADFVRALAFSPDGQTLASAGQDRTICLWSMKTKKRIRLLQGHDGWINSIVYSPDGQTLASLSSDLTIRLWDINSGEMRHVIQSLNTWAGLLTYSGDGRFIAAGTQDHKVRVWDTNTGEMIHDLEGHTAAVFSVAFDPEVHVLASGSVDGTIILWDMKSGRCLKVLRIPGPYEGMKISGVTGITKAQEAALRLLGAVED